MAIFQRIDEQIAQHLRELGTVAGDDRWPGSILHHQIRAAFVDQLAQARPCLLDQRQQVDRIGGNCESFRLDPRQRHQIVDEAAHALCLAEHDLEESLARGRVAGGVLVLQRLEEADQRRQRGAQFVAGIGDEVDAHLLGGAGLAEIAETDEAAAVG
jgi:hypothetical protein